MHFKLCISLHILMQQCQRLSTATASYKPNLLVLCSSACYACPLQLTNAATTHEIPLSTTPLKSLHQRSEATTQAAAESRLSHHSIHHATSENKAKLGVASTVMQCIRMASECCFALLHNIHQLWTRTAVTNCIVPTLTFLVLLKVPKFWSLCTMLESKGRADAVPSGTSHLQRHHQHHLLAFALMLLQCPVVTDIHLAHVVASNIATFRYC